MSEDVHVDSIVVFVDDLSLDELGNHRRVSVDGILDLLIEVISSSSEGDDNQEEVEVFLGVGFLCLLLGG